MKRWFTSKMWMDAVIFNVPSLGSAQIWKKNQKKNQKKTWLLVSFPCQCTKCVRNITITSEPYKMKYYMVLKVCSNINSGLETVQFTFTIVLHVLCKECAGNSLDLEKFLQHMIMWFTWHRLMKVRSDVNFQSFV
jgi:hypothetical protein